MLDISHLNENNAYKNLRQLVGVIILLCCFVRLISSTIHSNILECCPPGVDFVKTNTGLLNGDKYECLVMKDVFKNSNNFTHNNNSLIIQFLNNVPSALKNKSSIPDCKNQELLLLTGKGKFKLLHHSCVIPLWNELLAIWCQKQKENILHWVHIIQRCCPINYVFNSFLKTCVYGNNFYETIWNFIDYPVIMMNDPINCPEDMVIVEQSLFQYEFSFINDKLVVFGVQGDIQINDYCIEPIISKNDIKDYESRSAQFFIRICTENKICERIPCIRKCCPDEDLIVKENFSSFCKKHYSRVFTQSFQHLLIGKNFSEVQAFGILHGLKCQKFRLDPALYPDDAHIINNEDGSLNMISTQKHYSNNQYCLERILLKKFSLEDQKLYTFLCFDTLDVEKDQIRFKMYPIGLLISCSFFLITLLVYLFIPKLRNLPGKILICLVCSLFKAYMGIAIGQLMPTSNDNICFISGFFVYYCLIAAFAWMNVLCFDMWQTFGSSRRKYGKFKGDKNKFFKYSLYGWGLPSVSTTITISLTKSNALSSDLKPNFGHGRCWFTYDRFASANLMFFSGPVGILFAINFVLFIITLRYCNRVKREISKMRSSNTEKPKIRRRFFMDKSRFMMNTKLTIVMGITWLLEILSILFYEHNKTLFWTITDSFNVFLGVSVFLIFVFKQSVWIEILSMFGFKPQSSTKVATETCTTHIIRN